MVRLFKEMTPFDEHTKKLFTSFTEFFIHLGPLAIGDYDEKRHELVFRYPFSCQEIPAQATMKKFQEIKGEPTETCFVFTLVIVLDRVHYPN